MCGFLKKSFIMNDFLRNSNFSIDADFQTLIML